MVYHCRDVHIRLFVSRMLCAIYNSTHLKQFHLTQPKNLASVPLPVVAVSDQAMSDERDHSWSALHINAPIITEPFACKVIQICTLQ